jgi:hypothetical protein
MSVQCIKLSHRGFRRRLLVGLSDMQGDGGQLANCDVCALRAPAGYVYAEGETPENRI